MMQRLGLILFRAFGIPILMAFTSRIAAGIRLKIRRQKNQKLKEELKNADTPEERDAATKAIIDQFHNSDK